MVRFGESFQMVERLRVVSASSRKATNLVSATATVKILSNYLFHRKKEQFSFSAATESD